MLLFLWFKCESTKSKVRMFSERKEEFDTVCQNCNTENETLEK